MAGLRAELGVDVERLTDFTTTTNLHIGNALGEVMIHGHAHYAKMQNVIDAVSIKPVTQQVPNQYGTQYVDNRAVLQQQNVVNQDNRSVE